MALFVVYRERRPVEAKFRLHLVVRNQAHMSYYAH